MKERTLVQTIDTCPLYKNQKERDKIIDIPSCLYTKDQVLWKDFKVTDPHNTKRKIINIKKQCCNYNGAN